MKIHFVCHIESIFGPPNVGDWLSSPFNYFSEFFSRYTCIHHSQWAILWHEIDRQDVVIIGGGGMLDNDDQLNNIINRLVRDCDNVILWGVGTHKFSPNNSFGNPTTQLDLNLDRAKLIGVRDYHDDGIYRYLPCASCMHNAFSIDKELFSSYRKVGSITSARESKPFLSNIADFVSNSDRITLIVAYILTSDIIITSSYHGAYWSQLLGKKVVIPSERLEVAKYRHLRYPVGVYSGNSLSVETILEVAEAVPPVPDTFLAEARSLNQEFMHDVRKMIANISGPQSAVSTSEILAKRISGLEFSLLEAHGLILDLNDKLDRLSNSRADGFD